MVACTFADCVAPVRAQEQRKPELVKPENIQGCYELTLSAWRPNLTLGEDAVFVTPPHRIQLFAERGTQGWESEGHVVKPAPGVAPSLHRGSYWSPKNPSVATQARLARCWRLRELTGSTCSCRYL